MARTLDPRAHAVRREAFVDAAQRLIQVKGYEQMSIQDVLDDVGTSKGAFYHYFGSKADLLDAVVERLVDEGVARFAPHVADQNRTALDKLDGFFGDIAQYKAEHRELILGFLQVWYSDDNGLLREHFRHGLVGRLEPLMATIIRQGAAEGIFTVTSPEATSRVVVSLIQGANEVAGELFLAHETHAITLEEVERRLAAYPEALERTLGAPPGSVRVADRAVIREWFG